jgi:hypothetical protein
MQGAPLFFNLPWMSDFAVTTPILLKDFKLAGNFGLHQNNK